jgi:hypothetical protein
METQRCREGEIMLGRTVLKPAVSLLVAVAGLLLPRHRAPGVLAAGRGKAAGHERLLGALFAGGAPGKLLCAEVGGGPAVYLARCRFARGSDLDACASWVGAEVRAWLQQGTGRACDVEVSQGTFEPVVEARCRPE